MLKCVWSPLCNGSLGCFKKITQSSHSLYQLNYQLFGLIYNSVNIKVYCLKQINDFYTVVTRELNNIQGEQTDKWLRQSVTLLLSVVWNHTPMWRERLASIISSKQTVILLENFRRKNELLLRLSRRHPGPVVRNEHRSWTQNTFRGFVHNCIYMCVTNIELASVNRFLSYLVHKLSKRHSKTGC